jgi:hypothetical protein
METPKIDASDDASGFWRVVGQAVDNQDFLNTIKRNSKESEEDWRKRLETLGEGIQLNTKDLEALIKQYNGKTIIDLIYDCKYNWPPDVLSASYRT